MSRRLAGLVPAGLTADALLSSDDLRVLRPGRPPAAGRPLVILVHPGDYEGNPGAMDRTAAALDRLVADDPDVLAIHRESCLLARLTPAFARAIERATAHARVLYDPGFADSLPKAAADAVHAYDACVRPHVRMIGAYADPDHGCVTAVWTDLIQRGLASARVSVDPTCLTGGPERATPTGPAAGLMADGR